MKNLLLLSSIFTLLLFACDKVELDSIGLKDKEVNTEKEECVLGNCPTCAEETYSDPDNIDAGVEVIILEPIEVDEECGCVTSGFVKYLKNGITAALVKYENQDCVVGLAFKTVCVDGDCEHKEARTCQIEIPCQN